MERCDAMVSVAGSVASVECLQLSRISCADVMRKLRGDARGYHW